MEVVLAQCAGIGPAALGIFFFARLRWDGGRRREVLLARRHGNGAGDAGLGFAIKRASRADLAGGGHGEILDRGPWTLGLEQDARGGAPVAGAVRSWR